MQEFLNENRKVPTISLSDFQDYHSLVQSTIDDLKAKIEALQSRQSSENLPAITVNQMTSRRSSMAVMSPMIKLTSNMKSVVSMKKMNKGLSLKQRVNEMKSVNNENLLRP